MPSDVFELFEAWLLFMGVVASVSIIVSLLFDATRGKRK